MGRGRRGRRHAGTDHVIDVAYHVIDVAYHGSTAPDLAERTIKPISRSSLGALVDWADYDAWMDGGPHLETGLPYANVVIEAAGMAPGDEGGKPEWAASFHTPEALLDGVGMLFVANNLQDAERYGPGIEIDLGSPSILAIIEDPHVRTHRGFILLIEAGAPIPIMQASPGLTP